MALLEADSGETALVFPAGASPTSSLLRFATAVRSPEASNLRVDFSSSSHDLATMSGVLTHVSA